jgi:hypothetical protein
VFETGLKVSNVEEDACIEATLRDCISIFNQSLERTESDIVFVVQNSLLGWPPPEINLLDDIVEGGVLNSYTCSCCICFTTMYHSFGRKLC